MGTFLTHTVSLKFNGRLVATRTGGWCSQGSTIRSGRSGIRRSWLLPHASEDEEEREERKAKGQGGDRAAQAAHRGQAARRAVQSGALQGPHR
ncbi:hypothetical protein CEXT_461921 [Caerostris extrusa]|uniref:Uncharacterized protein n=1 Tax=Caerostris extrusa TaxID=172846 RepID=A0AAV4VNY6_CAEEX|nr:hypothetical protein CEXT_461921 [Caerostris extrusa]